MGAITLDDVSDQISGGGNALRQEFPLATLRDRFAMAALTGMLKTEAGLVWTVQHVAEDAYRYADAMLEARKESGE